MKPEGPSSRRKANHFIREWRKHRKLTQEALAERANLTPGAISQLENGLINYTQPTLEALALALWCSPGDLLSRDPRLIEEGPLKEANKIIQHLEKIDRISPTRARILLNLIRGFWSESDEQSSQTQRHDRSEPATPGREVEPSR